MEYKFVIGGTNDDFYKISYQDIKSCENAVYFTKILQTDSKLINFLFDHHFGKTLNKYFQLPFKSLWNNLYLKNNFERNDKICFILFSSYTQYIPYGFINTLRKKYPKCKIVCFYQDLANKKRILNPEKANEVFDLVLSFDHLDCQRYGWIYYPLVYSYTNVCDDSNIPESDVYFVGKAKDRLDEIIAAFQKFESAGLVCDFHIVGVPEGERRFADKIDYCNQMPYDENLKRIKKTRCILEIMQQGGHGYTLRSCEAIAHNRKLITNNPEIINAPFYNESLISVFKNIEDIDIDLIRDGNKDVDYNFKQQLSPIRMLEFLDNYFHER